MSYKKREKKAGAAKPLLILLDLDHTLLLGSYQSLEGVELLFRHKQWLWVYGRPGAREFVAALAKQGDIIVYTSAMRPYAAKACKALGIPYQALYSRKQCTFKNGVYRKWIRPEWKEEYAGILAVDDDLGVYLELPEFSLKVPEYLGDTRDLALFELLAEPFLMKALFQSSERESF